MATALNINVDVPNVSTFDVESFRRKLMAYATKLIAEQINCGSEHNKQYGLSDEELDKLFAGRPDFDESHLSDITKDDFSRMVKHHARKPIKGIEKWL